MSVSQSVCGSTIQALLSIGPQVTLATALHPKLPLVAELSMYECGKTPQRTSEEVLLVLTSNSPDKSNKISDTKQLFQVL